jgi:hypothetical protein
VTPRAAARARTQGHTCAKKVAKQNATVESAMPSEAGAAGRVALTTAAGREIGVFEFLSALDFTGSLPPNATLRAAQPADACGGLSGVAPGDWVYTERCVVVRRCLRAAAAASRDGGCAGLTHGGCGCGCGCVFAVARVHLR